MRALFVFSGLLFYFSAFSQNAIRFAYDALGNRMKREIVLQNSDVAFKEVVEKVLDEHVPDSNDAASFDATRQFTPDEMAELQRRAAESNKQVKDFSNSDVDETNDITSTPVYFGIEDSFESEVANFPISAPVDEDNDSEQEVTVEKNLNETQTFKLNISE